MRISFEIRIFACLKDRLVMARMDSMEGKGLSGKSEQALKELLRESKTLVLSSGAGRESWSARVYFAGDDEALWIALKPDARTLENVRQHPERVTFTVDRDTPDVFAQGEGRAIVWGAVDEYPDIKARLVAKNPEMKPFLEAIPGVVLVKIIPEKFYLTDHREGISPRQEVVTEAGARRLPQSKYWVQVMRFFSLSFTTLAGLIGAGFALAYPGHVNWELLPLVLLGAFLLHVGTNLTSEYFDFAHGVDRHDTFGGTKLLVEGYLSPRKVLWAGVAAFAVGSLIGFYLVARIDWVILLLGGIGVVAGYFYGGRPLGFKYRGLGEFMVFLTFGPLMVLGSYYVLTQNFNWVVLLASVPIGLLITAVLYANNTRDILNDSKAAVTTVPMNLGLEKAKVPYLIMVLGAYVVTVLAVILGLFPPVTLAVLVTLPTALKNVKVFRKIQEFNSPELLTMDLRTAQLVTQFGVVFALALFVEKLL